MHSWLHQLGITLVLNYICNSCSSNVDTFIQPAYSLFPCFVLAVITVFNLTQNTCDSVLNQTTYFPLSLDSPELQEARD